MNSFSKDSLITFFTEILVFILSSIALIVLARVLGPSGKGIYSLILLIPSIMIAFGNLGIGGANVYFVGSKKYKIEDVVSNSLISAGFLGIILILIFLGLLQFGFFQKFIHSNQISPPYLWIIVLIIPISLLLDFFQNIIRGKGEIINYNKTRILHAIIELIAIIIFLLILKQNLFGAVFSYLLGIVGATLFTIFLIKKITKFSLFLNKQLLKDSASYGGKVYLANALSFLNYRLDIFLIAFFLTPVAIGFYSLAVGVSERLFMISGALATVLFPRISSLSSSEANNFTPKIVRHTFFIMLISSSLLFFIAKPLITLVFGPAFFPAILPLIILLPGIIAFGIGGVLAADLGGRGKPQFAIYSSFACLVVGVALNFIFIPKWGVSGAAFVSSISRWVDTLIILIAFSKISKQPFTEILLIKKEDFRDYLQIFSNFKSWIQVKKSE
jgi:O-antigen/teichoic acid export membrane protein